MCGVSHRHRSPPKRHVLPTQDKEWLLRTRRATHPRLSGHLKSLCGVSHPHSSPPRVVVCCPSLYAPGGALGKKILSTLLKKRGEYGGSTPRQIRHSQIFQGLSHLKAWVDPLNNSLKMCPPVLRDVQDARKKKGESEGGWGLSN